MKKVLLKILPEAIPGPSITSQHIKRVDLLQFL
jgi:hypothetical protein